MEKAILTWFSSQIVMNLSNTFPLTMSLLVTATGAAPTVCKAASPQRAVAKKEFRIVSLSLVSRSLQHMPTALPDR